LAIILCVLDRARRSESSGQEAGDGDDRIRFGRRKRTDAAIGHSADEFGADAAGDQDVHRIERMGALAFEFVYRLLLRQIQSIKFDRRAARRDLEDQETATLTAVWADGSEVLASDCDQHDASPENDDFDGVTIDFAEF
jgi:hypothetical protein